MVDACTSRCPGCRSIASSSPARRSASVCSQGWQRSASVCSPGGATPAAGFGLARVRSRSTVAGRGHGAPSVTCTWGAEWLHQARVGVQESKERLRLTQQEFVKVLEPPPQLRASWRREDPAPRCACPTCILGFLVGLLFLIAIALPSSDCPNVLASHTMQLRQIAHVLAMGTLMFAAGALMALYDQPAVWIILRIF